MKYLDVLIEMTDDQKALKNRITGRESRGQMLTPGKHSTGGSERGEKKEKGKKPEPSKHRDGRLLRTKKGPNPKKGHIAADDLVKDFTAGPKGKLPEHTEYKRMALMMAEALGYEIDEMVGALAKGAGMLAKKAGQKVAGAAMNKADEMAEKMKKKKEAQQAGAPDPGMEKPGMQVAHTEYKRIGNLMAEIFGLREEDDNPTETDVAKANKDVHTKKGVKGETAKETKAVDKEIDKAMGPAKKGADGGIEGMKAKIRAAGEATRGQ